MGQNLLDTVHCDHLFISSLLYSELLREIGQNFMVRLYASVRFGAGCRTVCRGNQWSAPNTGQEYFGGLNIEKHTQRIYLRMRSSLHQQAEQRLGVVLLKNADLGVKLYVPSFSKTLIQIQMNQSELKINFLMNIQHLVILTVLFHVKQYLQFCS